MKILVIYIIDFYINNKIFYYESNYNYALFIYETILIGLKNKYTSQSNTFI